MSMTLLRLSEWLSRLKARTRAEPVIAWRPDSPLRRHYEKNTRSRSLLLLVSATTLNGLGLPGWGSPVEATTGSNSDR